MIEKGNVLDITMPGADESEAFDINDAGDILGQCKGYPNPGFVAYTGAVVRTGDMDRDVDNDGLNITDFSSLYLKGDIEADLTNDGRVNWRDLELFASFFGQQK